MRFLFFLLPIFLFIACQSTNDETPTDATEKISNYYQRLLQNLHLFFDRSSVELFADNGSVVITDLFFPTKAFNTINFYRDDNSIRLIAGEEYELEQIW